jgi:hypothetical protein
MRLSIFELIQTFEFEIEHDSKLIEGRVELFQNQETKTSFRVRTYERDLFRIKPTFPDAPNEPAPAASDETLTVTRGFPPSGNPLYCFEAENLESAVNMVLQQIEELYRHFDVSTNFG